MLSVEINNLNFAYAQSAEGFAFQDFNLRVEQGECLLIAGPSGSGKSSLLKIMNGLIPHYYEANLEGEVKIAGILSQEAEIYELARFVSSVFQNPKSQFFNINVQAELLFYLENRGFSRAEMEIRLADLRSKFKIDHLLERDIFELSGGEKQIIAIASAYIAGTEIVLLDEPSANLDIESSFLLGDILALLKDRGQTIIISEHRFYFLKDLIDRVIYLDQGQMKRSFTYQEFFALSLEARQRLGLRSLELEKLETKPVIKKAQTWEVRDFSYQFKQAKRSLDLAQLSLSFGEIIAVYGRNGVGKSSFMNSLMGLDQKASLTVSEAGQKLTARSRLKDSFLVMQDVGFQLFSDSVINELALGSKASLVEQEEVLRQLGLWEVKDQHPASLSGGEKQRVAIASALLSSARLICFDEASSGMDYLNMLRIKDLIHSISSVDKIILVASHDHEFLNLLASQIIVLD